MENNSTKIDSGLPRSAALPVNITESGLMSPTSLASNCFIDQRFSNKLQGYLIGYVNSIYSNYSVYK